MLLFWTVVIFVISLYPSSELPKNPGIPNLDKLVHLGMYLIFSFLWMSLIFDNHEVMEYVGLFVVVLIMTCVTEILQEILPISREASLYDGIANFIGAFTAIGIYRTFFFSRKK